MYCNNGLPRLTVYCRARAVNGLSGLAIQSANWFGAAVTIRYSREAGRGVYVGAQDFHSIVMTMSDEVLEEKANEAELANHA